MKLPQILDCTLRDGGYINNWNFSQNFAKSLYSSVSDSGCSYMEAGFFSPGSQSGLPWTNLTKPDIEMLRVAKPNGCKIAVMINYGEVDLKDIPAASEYGADMIRVACTKEKAEEATKFAADLSKHGYETTVNYMGISNYSNEEILALIPLMNRFHKEIKFFYVADSFGSLLPKRAREVFSTLRFGTKTSLGFHAHNNLQLAFANCLEAIDAGVDIIDGSIFGMGRGAGNLYTDAILAYYEQRDPSNYHLIPILQFADLHMEQHKDLYSWGYSLPQLLSGIFHCHPNYPTNLLREKRYTADDIYRMLRHLSDDKKSRFDNAQLESMKSHHLETLTSKIVFSVTSTMTKLCEHKNAHALLVCGGQSVVRHLSLIENFISKEQPAVFSVNNPDPPLSNHGIFFGNRRRLLQYFDHVNIDNEVILGVDIHNSATEDFSLNKVSRINPLQGIDKPSPFPLGLPTNSAIEAILALVQIGFKRITICGMDGYDVNMPSHYYTENDAVSLPEEFQIQNRSIEIELEALNSLSNQLMFSISFITPSRFNNHLNQ